MISTYRSSNAAILLGIGLAIAIAGTLLAGPRVALASMAVLVCMILIYAPRDPIFSATVLVAYLGMEGMYKYLTLFSTYVYLTRPALMAVIIGFWGIGRLSKGRRSPLPYSALMGLFVLWGLLEVFNPLGANWSTGLSTCLLFYAGPLAFCWIGATASRSSKQIERFLSVVLAVCTVVSALAILQLEMGRPWTEAHLPGYGNVLQGDWYVITEGGAPIGSFRPASTTSMGGGGAAWSSLGLTVAVGLLALPRKARSFRATVIGCLLINVLSLYVSGVRLFIFASILSVLIFAILTIRSSREMARGSFALAVLCVLGVVAWEFAQGMSGGIFSARYADTLSKPVSTFKKERGANFAIVIKMVLNNPLGTGYHASQVDVNAGGPSGGPSALELRSGETQFGATTSDLGVPGLLLHILLVIVTLWGGVRAHLALRGPMMRIYSAIFLASMSAYLLACMGGPALQGAIYYWLATGLLIALPRIERLERRLLMHLLSAESRQRNCGEGARLLGAA